MNRYGFHLSILHVHTHNFIFIFIRIHTHQFTHTLSFIVDSFTDGRSHFELTPQSSPIDFKWQNALFVLQRCTFFLCLSLSPVCNVYTMDAVSGGGGVGSGSYHIPKLQLKVEGKFSCSQENFSLFSLFI